MDKEILTKRFTEHESYIRRYAKSLTKDEEYAKDIVSESLIKIVKNHKRIRGESLKTYFTTSIRNMFLDMEKKKKSRSKPEYFSEITEAHVQPYNANTVTPDKNIITKELRNTIAKLPMKYKKIAVLLSKGYDYLGIVDELNIPMHTVKTRIMRMRIHLVNILKEEYKSDIIIPYAVKETIRRS